MLEVLVRWAVTQRLVVALMVLVLIAVGGYAFFDINVEAYPDPAPAIVEVIAQYPGVSAEEIERQVTVPLEVALAGMPGLESTRSKSLFGLSHLRNQFNFSTNPKDARIEVLNRLALASLPLGVTPTLSPTSPTGEIYRYTLRNPTNVQGEPVYPIRDLKALQDWTLSRLFRRIPRIADVVGFGGEVKRYEVQPDPERLRRFGITLSQLDKAIADSNANVGGDYLLQPHSVQVVRGLGLLGEGSDPTLKLPLEPERAQNVLRAEETRRLKEIRQIVLASTNNIPIRVGDVVAGGSEASEDPRLQQGVIVGAKTRGGQVSLSRRAEVPFDSSPSNTEAAHGWDDFPDVVQGTVLLRKGEQSTPALTDVKATIAELNTSANRLLPGVKLETFYDRTELIQRTTTTVHENLLVGMALVTLVLLVFLNHLPSALIVAANVPLALLFAFTILYFRGQSANMLSLGAIDFGIIVDSSVIMVECIHHRLSTGVDAHLPLELRIVGAAREVQRSLFFSTIIMVCALLPLFTMSGPEGRIFGPMADTYAFSLGGALLLALTVSPVLCRTFMQHVPHGRANFLVRWIEASYLSQLSLALKHRGMVIAGFCLVTVGTLAALPFLGREFMPQLEEGNIYVRGTFPPNVSLQEVVEKSTLARNRFKDYPEVAAILTQQGRPDDGTDPTGFYNSESLVSLKPQEEWPQVVPRNGLARLLGSHRARTKNELVDLLDKDLSRTVMGVDWNFSQSIRDNVMETMSGVKGENCLKIIGPDLVQLEELAERASAELTDVRGVQDVGIFSILGQTNLELSIDRDKCAAWNVSIADVQNALSTAVGGKAITQMVEGERSFDITLRWPERLRADEEAILNIPVDVQRNRVIPMNDQSSGLSSIGSTATLPSPTGSVDLILPNVVAQRRLGDLISFKTPPEVPGQRPPLTKNGASTIYREEGQRLIAVKFSVRDRDLASTVAEAQKVTAHLFSGGYRSEWSGEFEEMQNAISRLAIVGVLTMMAIVVLLYLALHSLLDVITVCSNVVVVCLGGVWALFITGENFNISAGVGFISILGVGMMDGLILLSGFNAARSAGVALNETLQTVLARYLKPLTMTPLLAIFGMLPAALSTRIGSESQKPLAIVMVGGMLLTLLLRNLIPVFYSLYGDRTPRIVDDVDPVPTEPVVA